MSQQVATIGIKETTILTQRLIKRRSHCHSDQVPQRQTCDATAKKCAYTLKALVFPLKPVAFLFSEAPKDDFHPKYIETSFQVTQRAFRYLKMHSKQRYKICILVSVRLYLGNLSIFEIKRALVLFSRTFQPAIKSFTKVRIFLIPLSIAFSFPNILCCLYLRKTKLNLGSEMGKIKLQKIIGNLLR